MRFKLLIVLADLHTLKIFEKTSGPCMPL